jgi:hypothetical protein
MRRGLEIREAFAPTRLSATHLRTAYELVSPVIERPAAAAEPTADKQRVIAGERRRRSAGGNR